LIWCGIGIVWYGSLDGALDKIKSEPFSAIVFGLLFAGMLGSWIAATVAPVVMDRCPLRYPVLTAGLIGGALATPLSTLLGFAVAEPIDEQFPKSEWVVLAPVILSILVGIGAGWRVGRKLSNTDSTADEQ
jgi:MFS family permease